MSNHDPKTSRTPRASRFTAVAMLTTLATLGALSSLLAACGGGPKSPGVAGSGKSPSTTSASSGVPKDFMQKLLSYAECMRGHGISDFPDPTPGPGGQGGGFSIKASSGSDLNPGSPAYKDANAACQSHLPNGGAQPRVTPAQLAELTKVASCMRAHGFPTFSDPNNQGTFVLHDIDGGSAQFQSAMQTCQSKVEYKGPMSINDTSRAPGNH